MAGEQHRHDMSDRAWEKIRPHTAEYLLADRGYDTDAIILKAADKGMTPVIPPKKNRKELREYDEYLYKLRHLVENAFLLLKRWRGIATRYANVAAVQIRCIAIKIYGLQTDSSCFSAGAENLMQPNPRRFCYPSILQSFQKTQSQFPTELHTAFQKSVPSAVFGISLQKPFQRGFQNDVLSPHFRDLLIILIQPTAVSTL